MITLPRRRFLTGMLSALAAPAIVPASALMPLRGVKLLAPGADGWLVKGYDAHGLPIEEMLFAFSDVRNASNWVSLQSFSMVKGVFVGG